MTNKYVLVFCFIIGNIGIAMGQSITLSTLLNLQNNKSSSYIDSYLKGIQGWVSNDSTFGKNLHYKWFKAAIGEQFEPYTKDQIHYTKVGSFDPALTYITLTKANFDNIKSSIQSSMVLDEMLLNHSKAKMYKYSNANVIIEMMEPLEALNYGVIRYAFFIYTKKDYINGFKIR